MSADKTLGTVEVWALHEPAFHGQENAFFFLLTWIVSRPDVASPTSSTRNCVKLQMSVTMQREWKRQQVVDCLTRIGGMEEPNVKPTFGTDEKYGYRSKLTPHYEIPYKGEVRGIGFQK